MTAGTTFAFANNKTNSLDTVSDMVAISVAEVSINQNKEVNDEVCTHTNTWWEYEYYTSYDMYGNAYNGVRMFLVMESVYYGC
ncbi:hypothetical protein QGN23_04075 [Chryseobacterium gotjawalense]|uniref:Uncharacterized protein n=1 Tax=Chryseobacterium gotjawalense TaxID=3042315 RepID=A0ABY8RH09_9FLAO|nr:hypothetical protein [Chryseobacterium sp. wdc7]WHF52463.1 hypothetical protein QGN23_04075 [Chryseobacterium sp. wdc7]